MNGLSKDMQNRVLDRLGFNEPPAVTIEALQQLYASWCMHIELPLPGGHVLMGTDAPESMGFTVNFGNNVHINR